MISLTSAPPSPPCVMPLNSPPLPATAPETAEGHARPIPRPARPRLTRHPPRAQRRRTGTPRKPVTSPTSGQHSLTYGTPSTCPPTAGTPATAARAPPRQAPIRPATGCWTRRPPRHKRAPGGTGTHRNGSGSQRSAAPHRTCSPPSRRRAADYWDEIRQDIRVRGFTRTLAARACLAVSGTAHILAARIERSRAQGHPDMEGSVGPSPGHRDVRRPDHEVHPASAPREDERGPPDHR